MSGGIIDGPVYVQEGIELGDAFGLEMPDLPEAVDRQIDKLMVQISDDLSELQDLVKSSGAENTAKAAKKYQEKYLELDKKVGKGKKKEAKLLEDAVPLFLSIRAELSVPAREKGVSTAISQFKKDAGPLGKDKAAEFEKQQQRIASEKDAPKRCAAYYQLEREIIKADLHFQEQANPGSTWQSRIEFATEDAIPRNLAKEGAMKGAGIGFKTPLPGGTLFGAAIGAIAGKVKEKLEETTVSIEEWEQMGKSFLASMDKKIADIAYSVPENQIDEFTKEAKQAMQDVYDEHFASDRLPETPQKLGKALMVANTAALQALSTLKRDYPPDTTPQVFVEDGKMTVAKQAPKLESLVMQGGGGKGVGYPAMLEEMTKSGMLENVDLLVGTSIGALNAACLACGGLNDEREILNLQITKQAFDVPGFKKAYPGVKFGKGVFPSCAGEMAKMDELTSKSISEQLKTHSEAQLTDELVAKLQDLDDETLARLGLKGADDATIVNEVHKLAKKIKHQDYGASDRTSQMITFKDLTLLHQLDPKNFKELTITGWLGTGESGKSVYFCAKDPNFADMPIAIAARISMGLPIFSPLYWNGMGPFYDGGIGTNAPTEAVPVLDELYRNNEANPGEVEEILKGDEIPLDVQQAMQKTMLMTFDEEGTANQKLHGEGRKTAAPNMGEKITVLKKKQVSDAINPEYANALKKDANKVYNSGVNTMQVHHGNQGTLSLGPLGGNDEEIEYAENVARMKGLEQIDQRQDQAVAVTCKSADEALSTFSDAEKQKFVDAGLPDNADPMVQELYRKCQAYLDLNFVCQQAKGSGDSTTFVNELVASQLTADCKPQATHLQNAYLTVFKGNPSPEVLKSEVNSSGAAIKGLPSYLQVMAKTTVLIPLQKKVRALGKAVPQEDPPSFVWKRDFNASKFEETIRSAAKAGTFPKTKDADKLIDAFKSYEKAEQKQFDKKSKPKERNKLAREALNKLDALLKAISAMEQAKPYSDNDTMKKYLGWLAERARGEESPLRSIVKGAAAEFPVNSFKAWDKKDWEKNKKGAINAGVLEDYGATGLTDAMEEAEKAAKEAGKATKPDDQLAKGRAAWKAWDAVIRAAKGIQSHSENANFSAYMESCVTQATVERDKFPAP